MPSWSLLERRELIKKIEAQGCVLKIGDLFRRFLEVRPAG
jgi:hypothetical protein